MPRVPSPSDGFGVRESVVPNSKFNAPTIQNRAPADIQQFGNAVGNAGNVMQQRALQAQQQANQLRVNDAQNDALREAQRLTADPEAGYIHLKGRAALERPDGKSLSDEYTENYQKQLREIGAGLGNDAQRLAFNQWSADRITSFQGDLAKHTAREYTGWRLSVHSGTVDVATQEASLNWGDREKLTDNRNAIKAAVIESGRIQGKSANEVQADLARAMTPMHASVIANAVDSDQPEYAAQYLEDHREDLTPQGALQLDKVIKVGASKQRQQALTDDLVGKHGGNLTAALREARETLSGEDEDGVVSRLKARESERKQAFELAQSNAADQAYRHYAEGGIDSIPSSILASMDGRDLKSLRATAKADAKARAAGTTRKTDPLKYAEFTHLPPATLAAMTPQQLQRDWGQYLSPTDFKAANKIILGHKNGDKEGLQIQSVAQAIESVAIDLGIADAEGEVSKGNAPAHGQMVDKITAEVRVWEATNGKKANPDVIREIGSRMKLDEIKLSRRLFDKSVYSFQVDSLSDGDVENAYVDVEVPVLDDSGNLLRKRKAEVRLSQISTEFRLAATAKLKSRNLPVTESAIAELWEAERLETERAKPAAPTSAWDDAPFLSDTSIPDVELNISLPPQEN